MREGERKKEREKCTHNVYTIRFDAQTEIEYLLRHLYVPFTFKCIAQRKQSIASKLFIYDQNSKQIIIFTWKKTHDSNVCAERWNEMKCFAIETRCRYINHRWSMRACVCVSSVITRFRISFSFLWSETFNDKPTFKVIFVLVFKNRSWNLIPLLMLSNKEIAFANWNEKFQIKTVQCRFFEKSVQFWIRFGEFFLQNVLASNESEMNEISTSLEY